jgi:hypothetical protein
MPIERVNDKPLAEKLKIMGQRIGYVPLDQYIGELAAFKREPIEYSLMVESAEATVVSVTRYDLTKRFPVGVQSRIRQKMN